MDGLFEQRGEPREEDFKMGSDRIKAGILQAHSEEVNDEERRLLP